MYTSTELTNMRNSGIRLWSSRAKTGYVTMSSSLNPESYEGQILYYLVNKALKFSMDMDQHDESTKLANLLVGLSSYADGVKLALPII